MDKGVRWEQEWHENKTHLKFHFVKDLKLPTQVAKFGVVLKVDRLVGNCGLDTIFLCKQKGKYEKYKAENLTKKNSSLYGQCVPKSYHCNVNQEEDEGHTLLNVPFFQLSSWFSSISHFFRVVLMCGRRRHVEVCNIRWQKTKIRCGSITYYFDFLANQ